MINALVKFGVKDQNVVLSTIGKIKKAQKEIAKKTNISFGDLKAKQSGAASAIAAREKQTADKQLQADKKEVTATERFTKAAQTAGNALMNVSRAAATLDPVAFIQGTLSAAGKVAGGVPLFGGAAAGALELMGVSVGAAAGAVGSAKTSTANALEINKRNAQNNLYGGELSFGAYETKLKAEVERKNAKKIAAADARDAKRNSGLVSNFARAKGLGGGVVSDEGQKLRAQLTEKARKVDASDKSTGWTPADKTAFIQSVSGQFGRIQTPLANVLNEFIAKGKNVEQFTQVASGNWNALGTDEGAILQQITNSFSGALPSVKQALQAELVKGFGDKVEKEDPATAAARAASARWARQEESHDLRVARIAANMGDSLYKLDQSLKEVQVKLISGANALAVAINRAVDIATPR